MKSKDLQKLINTIFPNEPISEIKNLSLNQLSIIGKKNDIDLNELEEFTSLETLSLRNFEITNDNAKQICKVKNLTFNNCAINVSDNINSNIEYLNIIRCNKIEHKLLNKNNLKILNLDEVNTISINELLPYTNLIKLNIKNCENITDIDKVSNITWLEKFSINKSRNIPIE